MFCSLSWEMFKLHNLVMALSANNKTYADLCLKTTSGACVSVTMVTPGVS